MASREEHSKDCVKALGEPFFEVHDWLDELWPTVGPCHRFIRHHEGGVEEVRKMWGDKAAEAAKIHIRKDFCGGIPTEEDSKLWAIMGGKQNGQTATPGQARKRDQGRKDFSKCALFPDEDSPRIWMPGGDRNGRDK